MVSITRVPARVAAAFRRRPATCISVTAAAVVIVAGVLAVPLLAHDTAPANATTPAVTATTDAPPEATPTATTPRRTPSASSGPAAAEPSRAAAPDNVSVPSTTTGTSTGSGTSHSTEATAPGRADVPPPPPVAAPPAAAPSAPPAAQKPAPAQPPVKAPAQAPAPAPSKPSAAPPPFKLLVNASGAYTPGCKAFGSIGSGSSSGSRGSTWTVDLSYGVPWYYVVSQTSPTTASWTAYGCD